MAKTRDIQSETKPYCYRTYYNHHRDWKLKESRPDNIERNSTLEVKDLELLIIHQVTEEVEILADILLDLVRFKLIKSLF